MTIELVFRFLGRAFLALGILYVVLQIAVGLILRW